MTDVSLSRADPPNQPGNTRGGKKFWSVLIEAIVLFISGIAATVAGHFLAQLLVILATAAFFVPLIITRQRGCVVWLLPSLLLGILVAILVPVDLALRRGDRWEAYFTQVEDSSRSEKEQSDGSKLALRYRTEIITVRWALLIRIPTSRFIYTPFFVHPKAPFVFGGKDDTTGTDPANHD